MLTCESYSGRKRICCSYREEGSDHRQPCSNCVNKGLKCIAGPASGRTRTGPALELAISNRACNIPRAFAHCTQCRRAKKRCSLVKNKTAAKCNECIKTNEACTFEAIQRTNARARLDSKIVTRTQSAPITYTKPARNVTQFIKTKLAYPVELDWDGDAPCQWCMDVGHGILGLGPLLEVEVLDMHDGNGYIEVSGGYFGAGIGPSRMCTECTTERLEIAACLEHQIQDLQQIEGMNVNEFDFTCVMDYLMPGMAASAPFSWCSVCPNPAFYGCCKPIDSEINALVAVEGAEQQHGCGLKLCNNCAESLVHEKGGDLEALVEGIREQDEDEIALRADVDLILPSGQLVRRLGGFGNLGGSFPEIF